MCRSNIIHHKLFKTRVLQRVFYFILFIFSESFQRRFLSPKMMFAAANAHPKHPTRLCHKFCVSSTVRARRGPPIEMADRQTGLPPTGSGIARRGSNDRME